MTTRELSLDTGSEPSLTDLTGACAGFLDEVEAADGLLTVFVPHATAGVVVVDSARARKRTCSPRSSGAAARRRWRHAHGSPGHGADHVLPLLVSPSLTVPVVAGRMTLGTWQSIALLDPNADNSRRTVQLGFLPG